MGPRRRSRHMLCTGGHLEGRKMRKFVCAALLGAASLALSLTAIGDASAASLISGKKLEVKVDPKRIPEESAALWKRFGGWCAISEWHPAIAKCEETKEGEDRFRILTLKEGGTIKEKLLEQTALSYKYAIVESPLPVKNYEARFSVTPDDDDEDEVNIVWAATYDAEGKPPKEARAVIDGIFKAGIDSIKAALRK